MQKEGSVSAESAGQAGSVRGNVRALSPSLISRRAPRIPGPSLPHLSFTQARYGGGEGEGGGGGGSRR